MSKVEILAQNWKYNWFGFWVLDELEDNEYPHLNDFIDKSWEPKDKNKIINYLKEAVIVITSSFPKEKCQICGDMIATPSTYQSDGEWLWPYDLAHFVECHNLRIPEKMYKNIIKNNYIPPKQIDIKIEDLPWPPNE